MTYCSMVRCILTATASRYPDPHHHSPHTCMYMYVYMYMYMCTCTCILIPSQHLHVAHHCKHGQQVEWDRWLLHALGYELHQNAAHVQYTLHDEVVPAEDSVVRQQLREGGRAGGREGGREEQDKLELHAHTYNLTSGCGRGEEEERRNGYTISRHDKKRSARYR